jgi:eukaryotic-like serine/threonine-protein kinase
MIEQLRAALADRYAVEREIGSGGMAHVFLARDLKHQRQVAIKVLRPDLGSAVGADRFLREIEIAARLSHPHVLPLHDSGEIQGLPYYVMPYVDGESLRHRLAREKRLSVLDALRIATEVADALAYAHKHGVLHRDIKPENILLSEGHAVVADFGVARAFAAAGGDRLTQTGVIVGSIQYMSPEQAMGGSAVDGRSDIYSLGCVLFEMLTGRPPFVGSTPQAILAQTITQPAPAIESSRPGVSPGVQEIVTRALAKEPGDRFDSAADLASALSGQTMSATLPPMVSVARATRSRRRTLLGAAAVIVALGIAAWVLAYGRTWATGGALSANRIAVLPFAVHGATNLAYLGEGVVDLLSRNLDGAEDLRTVDPGSVMTAVRHSPGTSSVIDAETGRSLGRRMGAGAFVLGSITSVGPRLRIHAGLYNAGGGESGGNATVEGDTAQLLALVDQLAAQLLVKRRPGAEHRLIETAALTTHSLPALKAFLNAEQSLRRGQLDSAIAGYQGAIAEDSTFGLAQYRLAIAAGWHERHSLSTDAVARGLGMGGRLTARDRRLMTAYAGYRRGEADVAEKQYRAILEDFPDDLEAEFELGDLLFQYNPLRGRPRLEARPLLDKVLEHDPGFL